MRRLRLAHLLSLCSVVLMSMVTGLVGCSNPDHPMLKESVREQSRSVTMTQLEDKVVTPPVTLEQAQREGDAQRVERAEPLKELPLALADVRKAALENNLDIQVQLVPPAIAGERVSEEEARFEASFLGSASRRRDDLFDIDAGIGPQQDTTEGELIVEVPLRTGGTVEVGVGGNAVDIDVPGATTISDTLAGFSISQPLLRNAGIGVNTAPITIASLQQVQQEASTKLAVMRTIADAESEYWLYYAANRILEVRYQQYERAQELLRQAQRLREAGVVPSLEVTRSRAGVSRAVDDIIRAETTRREAERELKRIMNVPGMGVGSPTVLLIRTDPRPRRLTFDVNQLADDAVTLRMEMLELELQLAVDALNLDVARNQVLPLVSLDFSFNYLGTDTSLFNSLDELVSGNRENWSVGTLVEIPLGNKAAKSRQRQAVLQRSLTLVTREQRDISIRKEVYDANDRLEEAWRRILAAREETLFSSQTYKGEEQQFLAGVRTSSDVLRAADFLAEAQIREISGLTEYEIAKVALAFATGNVLGKGRVRLVPYDPTDKNDVRPYQLEDTATRETSATDPPESLSAYVTDIIEKARANATQHSAGDGEGGPERAPTVGQRQ